MPPWLVYRELPQVSGPSGARVTGLFEGRHALARVPDAPLSEALVDHLNEVGEAAFDFWAGFDLMPPVAGPIMEDPEVPAGARAFLRT